MEGKKDGFEHYRYFVTSHGVKNVAVAICSHLQFRFKVTCEYAQSLV